MFDHTLSHAHSSVLSRLLAISAAIAVHRGSSPIVSFFMDRTFRWSLPSANFVDVPLTGGNVTDQQVMEVSSEAFGDRSVTAASRQ